MRPDSVPDARPEAPAAVNMAVPLAGADVAPAILAGSVIMLVSMAVIMLVMVGAGAVLVAHAPRMSGKSRCSTSTPATAMRLRTPRSYDGPGTTGWPGTTSCNTGAEAGVAPNNAAGVLSRARYVP